MNKSTTLNNFGISHLPQTNTFCIAYDLGLSLIYVSLPAYKVEIWPPTLENELTYSKLNLIQTW